MLVVPVMSVHQGGYSLNWKRKFLEVKSTVGPQYLSSRTLLLRVFLGKAALLQEVC